jgi:hypothetical protein
MSITRILVLAANPWDTERLGLDEECREISALWEKGVDEEKFEIRHVPAARSEDLLNKLQAFKPNIVHFSGHGEVESLLFADDEGNTHKIDKELLVKLFTMCSEDLFCVVINACNSELIAQSIAQHIDYAIGMNAKINDIAAVKFSKGFYRALFNGKKIKEAYQFSLLELELSGFYSQQDIPVLYDRKALSRNNQPPKPFVQNYQYDVLIHAASSEKSWAEQFRKELQKYLAQALNNQNCYLYLQTDEHIQLDKAALCLFVISEQYINEYQDILPKLIQSVQKQFLISRSETCANELTGLSSYSFYSEKLDFSNAAEFQELANIIAQHLQKLKKENDYKKITNPFNEPVVFIHTEPSTEDIELAKQLKPLFKSQGLACAIANPKVYKEDVKLNQKNCDGVLLVYGKNYLWTKARLNEYHLKQRRKEPLKIIIIHADCSKEEKDTEGLDIYDSVPVIACPPKNVDELIQRFVEVLK